MESKEPLHESHFFYVLHVSDYFVFEIIIKSPPILLSPPRGLSDVSDTPSIGVIETKEERLFKEPELGINTTKGMLLRGEPQESHCIWQLLLTPKKESSVKQRWCCEMWC